MKASFADRNIDIGKTLLVEVPDFDVTYKKYIVLVANSLESLGFVVINSTVNENVFRNEYLRSHHVCLPKLKYNFLDRDSYVNCTELRKFPKEYVINSIKKNPSCVVGTIEDEDMREIHLALSNVKTIAIKIKKEFGFV